MITGVTNAYGVYQEGASGLNYFAGNIGVGKTNPSHPIEAASGAYLSAGGQWISASSRENKKNIKDACCGRGGCGTIRAEAGHIQL
ncbi:MAG: hypothetical protein ABSB22_18025 [Thermodesulfobacteriota bacterium]